jgi:SAM-dependent methyltransferase
MSKIEFNPESNNCLICGSNKLSKFRAQAFDAASLSYVNIIECRNCIFAWQYPLGRTVQESVQFYEAAYKDKGQTQSAYFNPNLKCEIAKIELEFLESLPVKNRSLLDMGAGAGIFAEEAAANDWDVTAVDPAIDIGRIKENRKIKTYKGTTEQIPTGELFDVVTMWDVIEHTITPVELINNVKRYIKDGGWLVIETGNYKSAERLYGGACHWIYALDHRWYFSPESIKLLLIDAGFSEFIFPDKVLRPNWNGSINYAGPSTIHLLKWIVRDPFHLRLHLNKFFSLIRARGWEKSGFGIFAIAARKPYKEINHSGKISHSA